MNDSNCGVREPTRVIKKQRQQENKRRRIVQGSRPGSGIRGAPEPRRDAFIYRVLPDTSTEMLSQHLDSMGIATQAIDCVSNPNAMYKSFKVTTTVSNFRDLFNPEIWPEGICVRKYIPPRRGENSDY